MEKRFASENFPPEIQKLADQMNLSESAVPPYSLPSVQSKTAAEFVRKERPQILHAFEEVLYGAIPPKTAQMDVDIVAECPDAFDGLATRREIDIRVAQNGLSRTLHLLLYIPNDRKGKVPVFFGLNFKGNHACTADPEVRFNVSKIYPRLNDSPRFADTRVGIDQRGFADGRWCIETVLKRGYAAATMCYFDIYPDHPYGFEDSILRLFFDKKTFDSAERPCGAISAWAWGVSRAVDVLEMQTELNADKIMVHGLSRLGKTALWAGANDQRIALSVSFSSGTCGAKLSHRYCGEDFAWIDLWNPHWMVPKFREYIGHDAEIPVDQHQLLACIAPRLAYVASATLDDYADPRGEFLSTVKASEYYRLFGSSGVGVSEEQLPSPGERLEGDIGYYLRTGEHNCTPENWAALLDYADKRVK